MKKKTYKQMQNRLYREIKRRIAAEQMLIKPVRFVTCERKIETIKVEYVLPNYGAEFETYHKTDMARKIVNRLIADGYVEFRRFGVDCGPEIKLPISEYSRIEARLNVVRGIQAEYWDRLKAGEDDD